MAITNLRHAGIVVQDMAKQLEFYRDLLEMEVWADFKDDSAYVQEVTGLPGANIWMVKLRAKDGGSIELLQYLSHPQDVPTPRQSCDMGCNHVALQVDDLEVVYRKLIKYGIRFNVPPMVSPDGGAKVTYCRDPEGVILELVEILNK